MTIQQRRGFIRSEFSEKDVYGELDYVHQTINGLAFPFGDRKYQDYNATVFDRRIYAMRGITIRLPVLRSEDEGWTLFIQDRNGTAASSNVTIIPPPGKTINGASSKVISTNYGKVAIQWDAEAGNYFEIL